MEQLNLPLKITTLPSQDLILESSPAPITPQSDELEDQKQSVFDFGIDDLPLFSRTEYRLLKYAETIVKRGRALSIRQLIAYAVTAGIIRGTSERSIERWSKIIRENAKEFGIFIYQRRIGRSFVNLVVAWNSHRQTDKPTIYKTKENSNSTAKAGIRKLAHSILKGRKPIVGFGRQLSQNDPDWVTLQSLHWDNCKVNFTPSILYRPVLQALTNGVCKFTIVKTYEKLLLRWHGLATDAQTHYLPSGLAKELKLHLQL